MNQFIFTQEQNQRKFIVRNLLFNSSSPHTWHCPSLAIQIKQSIYEYFYAISRYRKRKYLLSLFLPLSHQKFFWFSLFLATLGPAFLFSFWRPFMLEYLHAIYGALIWVSLLFSYIVVDGLTPSVIYRLISYILLTVAVSLGIS